MTGTSISDAEFERLQNQLLELKNSNYTLKEKCRKHGVETLQWKEKFENIEKELIKSQNLAKLNPLAFAKTFQLNKSHKEKELIDSLTEEKDFYQRKLQSQEDEFKMTNDTLRGEIVSLMEEIKVLKNKLSKSDQSKSPSIQSSCVVTNDVDEDGEITMQITPNCERKSAKMSYAILCEKEQLETSLDQTIKNLSSLEKENQCLQEKLDVALNRDRDLEQIIKRLKDENNSYLMEIRTLRENLQSSEKEMENLKELAEKRKSTIDELQCHIEDASGKAGIAIEEANKKVNDIKTSSNKEMNLLRIEKRDLMEKIENLQKELEIAHEKNDQNDMHLAQLRSQNNELQIELERARDQLKDLETNKSLIEKLENEKVQIIKQFNDEKESQLSELNEQNESLKDQLSQRENLIEKLRQDIEDQIEERKIHEKKGVMCVRELKKQLNIEKKMKERLQERFGELHSEKSFEISSKNFDTQSVGSWSWLSSSKDQNLKNNSTFSIHSSTDGNFNTNGINSPVLDLNSSSLSNGGGTIVSYPHNQVLEKENTELVARLTKLQTEKWNLEEKMNSILLKIEKLESELEVKQKIITHYCMERRAEPSLKNHQSSTDDKFTVKKVVDFIKGDDNLKEINLKLNRMLEEVLTKNMFLTNNLEALTDELQCIKQNS